jgi:purine-binding chemotaxis protein CheW
VSGDGRVPAAAIPASRAILEQRARAIAVRPDDTSGAGHGAAEFMVFRRGSERFALPLADVVEVSRDARVTPLAGAAEPVVGLAGWRGRVLTVVDLNPGAGASGDHLVVVGTGRAAFAVLVDELEDARPLAADPESREQPRPYATGITADAITLLGYQLLQQRLAT